MSTDIHVPSVVFKAIFLCGFKGKPFTVSYFTVSLTIESFFSVSTESYLLKENKCVSFENDCNMVKKNRRVLKIKDDLTILIIQILNY